MQLQLAIARRPAQVADQVDLALMGIIAALLIHLQAARQLSGIVHGDAGAAHQLFGSFAVQGIGGDANPAVQLHLHIDDSQGLGQTLLQAVGNRHRTVAVGMFQQQQELVGQQPRQAVTGAQAALQALAELLQHLIAAGRTIVLVDALKVADAQVQQGHRPPGGNRAAQALQQ